MKKAKRVFALLTASGLALSSAVKSESLPSASDLATVAEELGTRCELTVVGQVCFANEQATKEYGEDLSV